MAEEEQLLMLSLDDCVLLLTEKHGTLKAAFDKLDFFQDGRLSCFGMAGGVTPAAVNWVERVAQVRPLEGSKTHV